MLWTLTAVISDEDYTQRFAVRNLFASSGGNSKRNYTNTLTNYQEASGVRREPKPHKQQVVSKNCRE